MDCGVWQFWIILEKEEKNDERKVKIKLMEFEIRSLFLFVFNHILWRINPNNYGTTPNQKYVT